MTKTRTPTLEHRYNDSNRRGVSGDDSFSVRDAKKESGDGGSENLWRCDSPFLFFFLFIEMYVMFEREAREYLFSHSLTQMTHSCHLHNQYPCHSIVSLARNNINRAFSLFLGYAIDRHDARTQVRFPRESSFTWLVSERL